MTAKLKSLLRADPQVQELLFRANPLLGHVFTISPVAVFCIASLCSIVFLLVPAHALRITHISSHYGDVGFLATLNWSLMYPLILPLFLALAGLACKTMYSAVRQFISPGRAIIFDQNDVVAVAYPDVLAEMMRKRGRLISICSVVLALLVVAIDTHDLWPGFFTGHFPDSRVAEWDTAFRLVQRSPLFRWEIFCFDVVAYLFEFSIVLFGIFFVLTSWNFLLAIASSFDERRPPFHLQPIICDLEKRLGLGPLSWVFHWLLFLGIAFSTFAAVHRLQQVDTLRQQKSWTYVATLFHKPKDSGGGANTDADHGISFSALIDLTNKDYAIPQLMNPSSWLAIVFIGLPGVVVCMLPLGRIYQYVHRSRDKLLDENARAYNEAVANGDSGTADRLKAQVLCLEEANIWPNGNTFAWTCLILLGGLLVVSIAPPLLPFAISAGAIPSLYAFATKKK